ncbi:hypothetical protein B7463_g11471, partial [Scytalidium lignicola]
MGTDETGKSERLVEAAGYMEVATITTAAQCSTLNLEMRCLPSGKHATIMLPHTEGTPKRNPGPYHATATNTSHPATLAPLLLAPFPSPRASKLREHTQIESAQQRPVTSVQLRFSSRSAFLSAASSETAVASNGWISSQPGFVVGSRALGPAVKSPLGKISKEPVANNSAKEASMAEAAFFSNMAAQRDARKRRPSTNNNKGSASLQAQSKSSLIKKPGSSSSSRADAQSASKGEATTPEGGHTIILSKDDQKRSDSVSIASSNSVGTHSTLSANKSSSLSSSAQHLGSDRMLSTPLPDYKRAANQSNRARAAAASHAAANRKSSSVSATSSDRNKHVANASAAADSMGTNRVDVAGRSSSVSGSTGSSGLTAITSSDLSASQVSLHNNHPFVRRNGRRYLRDPTLPYPLPCDLAEIHRQTLRTMLYVQVFGGPTCSPTFAHKPPKRVLDVGCGPGFWSVMCHRHFAKRGYSSIAFTGIDIAPLAPVSDMDADMNWRFVQHDLRRTPLPFRDEEFNLIMIKDMSLVSPISGSIQQQELMDDYLRILKPGGTIEFWDGDYAIRMLLPHPSQSGNPDEDNHSSNSYNNNEDEEPDRAEELGLYTLTPQTSLGPPQNQYLADYNGWITKALEPRKLTPMPCTLIRPLLVQEPDLTDISDWRLAIPLGEEVRWEKEGIGGAVTATSNSSLGAHTVSKGKTKESGQHHRKHLTPSQAALRSTALTTVVQMIESLEPMLREASGKGQDEWDRWYGSMMNDLLKQNGASWGECLEIGAWWAQKKKPAS